jgi:hypothetical protein
MENIDNAVPVITPEQYEELYQQFTRRFKLEEPERQQAGRQALPTEILYEMDGANSFELRSSIKKIQQRGSAI